MYLGVAELIRTRHATIGHTLVGQQHGVDAAEIRWGLYDVRRLVPRVGSAYDILGVAPG